MTNQVTTLFGIKYPIIQAGMVWCAGWELASAVSNAGGLGIIGSGSMYPNVLREHIQKCKAATNRPFAVNVPLLYPDIDQHMSIIAEEKVPIVFTSAGNPATWTNWLKDRGICVVHVVSSTKFAQKAEQAGVDAIVAEGFEAGGHNGREETTTLVLVPAVVEAVNVPVIAAGGIATGQAMAAAFALGAQGVQVGSRFVLSDESSAHPAYKQALQTAGEGDTKLVMKELTPVRLLKNDFYRQIEVAEQQGAPVDMLKSLLGKGRAKLGMFEGDLQEGELEIGQIIGQCNTVKPAKDIVQELWQNFQKTLQDLQNLT